MLGRVLLRHVLLGRVPVGSVDGIDRLILRFGPALFGDGAVRRRCCSETVLFCPSAVRRRCCWETVLQGQ